MKRLTTVSLVMLLFTLVSCTSKGQVMDGPDMENRYQQISQDDDHIIVDAEVVGRTSISSIGNIDKYGDPILEMTSGELMDLGFEYADMVEVRFLDQRIEMPIIPDYRYVGAGEPGLLMWEDRSKPLSIEIFNGSFVTDYRLAEARRDSLGDLEYVPLVEFPVDITIEMKEKGGYSDTYAALNLTQSNNREDYPDLTDEEFANFREVTTTGIGTGKLYRSSSPVNPEYNRNRYADLAAEKYGIRSIINLEDLEKTAREYPGFEESYYSRVKVIYLNLGVDLTLDYNRTSLVKAMEYIAGAETPVLVHCMLGKDRAGMFSALLECLMGASAEEIREDYMTSYYNFYGLERGTEQYEQVSHGIETHLKKAFGVENLEGLDLQWEAEHFFLKIGVSPETLETVKKNLQ